ncbi:hypothetical protein [Streptomyces griseosporeus]|uniref:hypothetical protein n=1 Tax=Streptomyces griseosporeus TaxID=1910 RepID=UPI0036FC3ECC
MPASAGRSGVGAPPVGAVLEAWVVGAVPEPRAAGALSESWVVGAVPEAGAGCSPCVLRGGAAGASGGVVPT